MSTSYYHPVTYGYGTGMLVAAADTTAADYPGDNRCRCYQPPQAGPGVTKLVRAAPGCVVGRARPGWAVAGRGRRRQALPMRPLWPPRSTEVVGGCPKTEALPQGENLGAAKYE